MPMCPHFAMIKLSFTEEAIAALHYERYHHPHPRVQRKMEALYLKSQGLLLHREIAAILQVSEPTLVSYLRDYAEGGIEQLKVLNFYQPQSELAEHQVTIEAYFREHPPQSLGQAAHKIEELTGIKRSREQVRQFLHRIGMSCRRVGVIPAKAEPVVQEAFKKKA
jgi:transposase